MTDSRARAELDNALDGALHDQINEPGITTGPLQQEEPTQPNTSPLERESMTHAQKHFSASELAGLPGMPTSARRVSERAKTQAWPARPRKALGGGSEYPISCLPAITQAALAEKFSAALAPSSSSQSSIGAGALFSSDDRAEQLGQRFDAKPESTKAEARARLTIVLEYFNLAACGVTREAIVDVVTKKHTISEATLRRYLALVKGRPQHLWLVELCPAYTGRTARFEICAEAEEFLKADYLRAERPSARACIARLERVAKSKGWTLPSTRTLLRRIEELPRAVKVMKRDGMKAAKALFPPQIRDKAALHALQIINGDGYKHNLWVRFPDGEIVRAKTWFWQDVHSSKMLGWRIAKSEHTEVIQLSFGDICERYGIPHAVTIDNTLAAANKTMSGGIKHRFRFKVREDEPDGVFKLLGVDVHWATPGHGQAKPIERAFGVGGVGEYIDKAPEFAGAWTGSSTQDKPEYDVRHKAVELADLERVIAREIAHWNSRAGRRSALHNGRSFDEVFNESYARVEIRKASEAQRRLWLLSTEPVNGNARDGSITLDAGRVKGEGMANRYWDPALIDHAGKKLVAKFDPQRLHESVQVYTLDGRWICTAACDRPAGFNDQGAARERNRARNDWKRGVKMQAIAEVRMSTLDVEKAHTLASAGGVADASIPAPKVVRPVFADPLQRPHYEPVQRTHQPTETERAEQLQLETAAMTPEPVNVLELHSDSDRHKHWLALNARRAAGEQLVEADEQFWQHWQTQDHYRITVELEADFEQGLEARRIA